MTETANVAETAMASNSQASANANGPSREDHILQPRALAKSNAATYAEAVKRDPPESPMKQSTRANDFGGDHLANAASSSATVARGSEPAIGMSPTVLRHNRGRRQRKSRRHTSRRRRRRRRRKPEDSSYRVTRRRRHRQRSSADNPTGLSATTPTWRKATPDSEG